MADPKRLVALFDIHLPHCIPALYVPEKPNLTTPIFRFLRDFNPDILVYGGDLLNLDCISYFNRGKPKLVEGKRLSDDFAVGNQFLDRVARYIGKKTQQVFLMGNHEDWITRLIEEEPNSHEGFIEIPRALRLKERGIELIPRRGVFTVGKLNMIHGDYRDKYIPTYHAKAIAELYNRNVTYGHHHTEQSYIKVAPIDTHPIKTQCVGTLGVLNPDWKRNEASSWTNSFYVAYVQANGNFNGYVVNIVRNCFVFQGKTYK